MELTLDEEAISDLHACNPEIYTKQTGTHVHHLCPKSPYFSLLFK